mgnify:CR=1 FL=1
MTEANRAHHLTSNNQCGRSAVRIGVIQWQMCLPESYDDWLDKARYFIKAMAGYQADFIVFPEFFNVPLMGIDKQSNPHEAIRLLANYAEKIIADMSQFAVTYSINVIAGSIPEFIGDRLYNNAYLCRRDGSTEVQSKIHITPDERRTWLIEGGNDLQVFDTDAGKVGILICYDAEFPELSRLLAKQDMEILFVPFWTDTKSAFLRVQRCAQARAIENECYVAIAGSVGNLSQVANVDIQYAQSAIYSPSDFGFPEDATVAVSTANVEMAIVADVDLERLAKLKSQGAVTNDKDRREDLYQVKWLQDDAPSNKKL